MFFNHLCNHTFYFICENTDSREFVVLGISISHSYFSNVYKYNKLFLKLL